MLKKISILGGFSAFLLFAMLAPAQTAPATESDGAVLGQLEGTVNFCANFSAKINPEAASTYKMMGQLLVDGQSQEAIAKIRNSKEYKDAFDQVSKKLEGLSAKQAVAACKVEGK